MSVRRGAVLVGLILGPAAAEAEPRRVGFANVAGSVDPSAAIAAAHGQLEPHGYRPVDSGAVRAALEKPLPEATATTPALGRARDHLAGAREAYARFEYDRALGELGRIDDLLLDREPSQPVIELLIQRYLLAGQVHEGRERPAEAIAAFRTVRHLDPDRTRLDAGEYRPKVVSLYQRSAPTGQAGALEVQVTPSGARVWLDGKPIGAAPVDARDLAAGRHWVVATALGRSPKGTLVDIDGGKRRSLDLELEARSPAERIAEVRRTLESASSRDDLEAGAAELAGAAEVEVLVLVRARGDQIEGAAYDTARGELGAWAPLPSRRFWVVLAPSAGAGSAEGGALFATSPERDDSSPSSYRTGWGKGLLIAGGVVVTGAILYAVLAGGDDTYTIGGWCYAGGDCQ
jgi:hypothetical protein